MSITKFIAFGALALGANEIRKYIYDKKQINNNITNIWNTLKKDFDTPKKYRIIHNHDVI